MAQSGEYELDYTFSSKKTLEALVEAYGTPLYVYDRATLEARHQQVCAAFSWSQGFRQFFPVRAADHPEILRVLLEAGSGLLCGSASELHMATLAGAKGKDLLFHACFPGYAEWDMAISSGATVVLDHTDQLEELRREEYGDRALGLRVCTDQKLTLPGQAPTKGYSKSGMLEDELMRTAIRAAERGFRTLGLYMMAGSHVYQQGYYEGIAKALLKLVPQIQNATGCQVVWCNLGGGFCWDHKQEYTPDIQKEARRVRNLWERLSACQPELASLAFYTELGRYIAMPAGILLTRVRGLKHHIWTFAGVDASACFLPNADMFGVHYHASALGRYKLEGREVYHLVGPTSDGADAFGGRYVLPPLETGDILVFHGTGARCQTASNGCRAVSNCPEVLLDREGPRLISERGTLEDRATFLLQREHQQKHEDQKERTKTQ